MEAKRLALDPIPPRPAHAELNLAISLGEYARRDDPTELICDDTSETGSVSSSELSVEELARDYFHVSLDNDSPVNRNLRKTTRSSGVSYPTLLGSPSSDSTRDGSTSTSQSGSRAIEQDRSIYAEELQKANEFADCHKSSGKAAGPQALRAYSLWHEQGLEVPVVATILRNPPIQNRTVINYLCDAICHVPENLKCPPERILSAAAEHQYQPFLKAHRDLFARATSQVNRQRAAR